MNLSLSGRTWHPKTGTKSVHLPQNISHGGRGGTQFVGCLRGMHKAWVRFLAQPKLVVVEHANLGGGGRKMRKLRLSPDTQKIRYPFLGLRPCL